MKAWRVHEYGAPAEVLTLDDVHIPTPGDDELLISVEAITLNFNDLDGIHGRYKTVRTPMPYIPGMEVMGTVDACGPGTEAWAGSRVVAIPSGAFGGYAEYVTAATSMTFEMPASIPLPAAAGILMPFHLGWLALYERGGLQDGETLLVHAGAGGAGSAAIQLGVHAGARVIATAGSPKKLAVCRDLGADVVINYREEDFPTAVLAATDGRGVDVVLPARAEPRIYDRIAPLGRHTEFIRRDVHGTSATHGVRGQSWRRRAQGLLRPTVQARDERARCVGERRTRVR